MANNPQFHHLTFVTKYSRVPSEDVAFLRYNAMMEIGREPLLLDTKGSTLIGNIFQQQAQKLGITIIIENILSNHAHLLIDSNNMPISGIVQKLKGSSSYIYNRTFKHKGPVWAVGYSDIHIDNEKYLKNAIVYIRNNHLKHNISTNYVRSKST